MKNTVVVLGAGASFDYGLPTGDALLAQITELCEAASSNSGGRNNAGLFRDLVDFVFQGRVHPQDLRVQLKGMAHLIRGQMPPSIDWFLGQEFSAKYKSFRELGMLAIAWCIGGEEQHLDGYNDPIPRSPSGTYSAKHWYRTFWQSLSIRNVEDFQRLLDEERLRVVTFNYERTFEQFVLNRLRALHLARIGDEVQQGEIFKQLSQLDICHVYGSLGDLQRLPLGGIAAEIKRGQISNNLVSAVQDAAKELQVIAQERNDREDANFGKARRWIESSDRLVFLGFGFDETNLRALGFPGLAKRPSRVFATTYGLGAVARDSVCQFTVKDWVEHDMVPTIHHQHQDWDIESYLRHFQPFRSLAAK